MTNPQRVRESRKIRPWVDIMRQSQLLNISKSLEDFSFNDATFQRG